MINIYFSMTRNGFKRVRDTQQGIKYFLLDSCPIFGRSMVALFWNMYQYNSDLIGQCSKTIHHKILWFTIHWSIFSLHFQDIYLELLINRIKNDKYLGLSKILFSIRFNVELCSTHPNPSSSHEWLQLVRIVDEVRYNFYAFSKSSFYECHFM